jgi:hypothetical protein
MASLGSHFVDRDGNSYSSSALDGKVIGLYFSASWYVAFHQIPPFATTFVEDTYGLGSLCVKLDDFAVTKPVSVLACLCEVSNVLQYHVMSYMSIVTKPNWASLCF